jgi:hypothetical protein
MLLHFCKEKKSDKNPIIRKFLKKKKKKRINHVINKSLQVNMLLGKESSNPIIRKNKKNPSIKKSEFWELCLQEP